MDTQALRRSRGAAGFLRRHRKKVLIGIVLLVTVLAVFSTEGTRSRGADRLQHPESDDGSRSPSVLRDPRLTTPRSEGTTDNSHPCTNAEAWDLYNREVWEPTDMPDGRDPEELTRFLNELGAGESTDTTRLMPILYAKLKAIAEGCFRAERPGQTLQATALVHEAYVKLFDSSKVQWHGRKHFYAVAAKAMRHMLVDQARRRKRAPKARQPATLEGAIAEASGIPVDLIDLDAALDDLAALDERQSRVVELKYFGGLAVADVARVLDVSVTTVEREWRSARAWLASRLGDGRA